MALIVCVNPLKHDSCKIFPFLIFVKFTKYFESSNKNVLSVPEWFNAELYRLVTYYLSNQIDCS